MEYKIFTFSFYLSILFFIVQSIFLIDEMRIGISHSDIVIDKKFDIDNSAGNSLYFFDLTTASGKKIGLNRAEYAGIHVGDTLKSFNTQWFDETKGYELIARGQVILSSNFGAGKKRLQIIIASLAGMILAFISFRSDKFELRVSLSFIVFVITAVRWWILGKY